MSNTYYELIGTIDGESEILFGSFDREDCAYEQDAERDTWKADGYKGIKIVSREVAEEPDPEVYGQHSPTQEPATETLTPTWEAAARVYIGVLENPDASYEARTGAREEILRLARSVDARAK